MRRIALVALALLVALVASGRSGDAAGSEPLIRAGDRVVFFGDSITEQRLYTRYVQQYVDVRHPEWDVRFYNAGWGGDTAAGGLLRLERDVYPLAPTLVTLFFGMNDAGYRATDEKALATYRESMTGIVKALRARGTRVVVFTPGCVDYDKNPALLSVRYNDALEAFGKTALAVAKAEDVAGVDVFHPMLAFQTERKRADPAFGMIPDSIHPSPAGHLALAGAMLDGLGLSPLLPLGKIDVRAKGETAEGLRVERASDVRIELVSTAPVGPGFWFDTASSSVMETSGFLDARAGQRLTVTGLAQGEWEVEVDGGSAGRWTAAALARGVLVPGVWSAAGKDVHDLVSRKEDTFYDAWRNVRLPLEGRPGLEKVLEGLSAVDEGYCAMIRARAAPKASLEITLTRAPTGENLALKKGYVASDPNLMRFGVGALTDGSWEGDFVHCFSTGQSPQFPKMVTIDLEKSAKVATIRLGVPDFGSTKSVLLSVSGDGKHYHEVGRVEFSPKKAERKTLVFEPKSARYVRLSYLDHHEGQTGGYPPEFAFTTEVEVYGPAK